MWTHTDTNIYQNCNSLLTETRTENKGKSYRRYGNEMKNKNYKTSEKEIEKLKLILYNGSIKRNNVNWN